jgi:hypothetical protein
MLVHSWKRKKGGKKLLFFILLIMGAGVPVFFFMVVLFFSLFSSFLTSTPTMPTEEYEMSKGFPGEGKKYFSIYEAAEKKYGVPWNILAAIHKVETDFGRNLAVSVAGAKGHTQFMDKTWIGWRFPGGTKWGDLKGSINITDPKLIEKYGGYEVDADGDGKADPYSPMDAIFSTANFLKKNHKNGMDWFKRGGPVWQYNHDYENYVLKVKQYADNFAYPVLSKNRSPFLFPVLDGTVTSLFGERFHPIKKVWIHHQGIDIGKKKGAPILAAEEGNVIISQSSIGYGWKIVIHHGDGLETLYAHMEEEDVNVSVGQHVQKGQTIAFIGNNGWSTGPHLYFEVHKNGKRIDPLLFLEERE